MSHRRRTAAIVAVAALAVAQRLASGGATVHLATASPAAPNDEAHDSARGNQDEDARLAEAFGAELAGGRTGGRP